MNISKFLITLFILLPIFLNKTYAATLSDALANGKVDGEIRSVLYARHANGLSGDGVTYLGKANGVAVGGYLGYTTQEFNHFSARIAVHTTQPVDGKGDTLTRTNLVNGEDGYTLLGNAYLRYDNSINKITLGRQDLYTPLVSSDDARVIKDLFSGISATTKAIPEHTINFFYLHEMSGMDNGNQKKDWVSMSKVLGASYDEGMYGVGLENKSLDNLNAQLWYYQIPDTVSMLFAGGKYKQEISDDLSLIYEGHYWKSKSKQKYELDTSSIVDYYFTGLRISAEMNKFTLQLAFDHMGKETGTKTIHQAHGNFAEYTFGFLLGSGAYGTALAPINPNNMTSMNAKKITGKYKFSGNTTLFVGYMMADSNDTNYQSDAKIMDIALFMDNIIHKNVSLALIYENWDADGNNFFVDNDLIRATLKYKF